MHHTTTVNQRFFNEDSTLMSSTLTDGTIQYANAAFCDISGFTFEEMVAHPHNIVRHPDMPRIVFEDMWRTLKSGHPWFGLVKNRAKDGSFYWVDANVTPICRQGRIIGYMSVRTKPSDSEVKKAENIYKELATSSKYSINQGVIFRRGLFSAFNLNEKNSLKYRLTLLNSAYFSLLAPPIAIWGPYPGWMAVLGVGAFIYLGYKISASQFLEPIISLKDKALSIATGEKLKHPHDLRLDELGFVSRSVAQLGLMFRWLIKDVSSQIYNLEKLSSKLDYNTNQLKDTTHKTAATLEQTTAFITQMASAVENNANSTKLASKAAQDTAAQAQAGGDAVKKVEAAMAQIMDRTQKMTDIVSAINTVAFQTNILALNAAVEAARAGEHGRGFAVVASEVRTLSKRCADSAKEIEALIEDCVATARSGSTLVSQTTQEISEVVTHVAQVSTLIDEISYATQEQRDGLAQATHALHDMDQASRTIVAHVDNCVKITQTLNEQAFKLSAAVGCFK